MRIAVATTRPWDLAAIAGATLAAVLAVALGAPTGLRVPLGLALVLFCPGYAFVAALYPERSRVSQLASGEDAQKTQQLRRGITPLERLALSLGLSIAIVPLLGLALNYTPAGIRLWPVVATVSVFTLLCLAVGWWRRERLAPDDRLLLAMQWDAPSWGQRDTADKVLTVALAASVLFAAGALVYVLVTPRSGEAFTEFYILGPTGKAACYPVTYTGTSWRPSDADLDANCPLKAGNVTIGIVNHEGHAVDYTLRMLWTQETRLADNTTRVEQVWPIATQTVHLDSVPVDLSLNATFKPQHEQTFTVPPPPTNGTLRLSFQLYMETPPPTTPNPDLLDSPYRRLHLWLTS